VLSIAARQSIGDGIPGGSVRGGLCRHRRSMEVRDGLLGSLTRCAAGSGQI
jgi:hypothetical protein